MFFEPLEGRVLLSSEMLVERNAVDILHNDTTPSADDGTDFLEANVKGGQNVHTFSIFNSGDTALELDGSPRVKITGGAKKHFKVLTQPAESVAPGGSTTFQVRFDPKATGLKAVNVVIANNDEDESPYRFRIQGTGFKEPDIKLSGAGQDIVNGDSLPDEANRTDFGSATGGATVTRKYKIKNTGSKKLVLGGTPRVAIEGAAASDFTVVKQPKGSLKPGEATTFKVRFEPTSSGLRNATVSIANDDPGENPYTFGITGSASGVGGPLNLSIERVGQGFDTPLFAASPPGDTERLFVVEQGIAGPPQIRILNLGDNTIETQPFLQLSSDVLAFEEQGLLGLAFDPAYSINRRFYVCFTNLDGDVEVRRYTASEADPNIADTAFDTIIQIEHSQDDYHNGGWIGFGLDSFLYVAVGDAGGNIGNDPDNNAQNKDLLVGKILRLDVGQGGAGYSVPLTNPFVNADGADEIWAYGLRNPWRSSFDKTTGDLWIADVGQSTREEINFQVGGAEGGQNYGWRVREGSIKNPNINDPNPTPRVDPIYDYGPQGGDASVTGGYVYRGAAIPDLQDRYVFGDFETGKVFSLVRSGSDADVTDITANLDPDGAGGLSIDNVASFGEDSNGELYIVDYDGDIFRIIAG